jgi:hypothetical protein
MEDDQQEYLHLFARPAAWLSRDVIVHTVTVVVTTPTEIVAVIVRNTTC